MTRPKHGANRPYGGPGLMEGRRDCHENGYCEYPTCLVLPANCWIMRPRKGFAYQTRWTFRRTITIIQEDAGGVGNRRTARPRVENSPYDYYTVEPHTFSWPDPRKEADKREPEEPSMGEKAEGDGRLLNP